MKTLTRFATLSILLTPAAYGSPIQNLEMPAYETKLAEDRLSNMTLPYKGPYTYRCGGAQSDALTVVFYETTPPKALFGRGNHSVMGFKKKFSDGEEKYVGPGLVFKENEHEVILTWMGSDVKCSADER